MAFEKGNKLGKGRKKGSVNKSSNELKEVFGLLLSNNVEKLQKDIDSMKPEARFSALMTIAKFVIPQLKSTEISIEKSNFHPLEIILTNDNK